MTIGQRIAQVREQHGWSQRRLAAQAGVTQTAIHLIETNQRTPGFRTVQNIAAAFEISLDELVKPAPQPQEAASTAA